MRSMGSLQAGSGRRGAGFNPSELLDALFVFDHVGASEPVTGWAPTVDQHDIGPLVGGTPTIEDDWLGTGKALRVYGSGTDSTGSPQLDYDYPARTWVWVGELPETPADGAGFCSSSGDMGGVPKIFPMYYSSADGGSIGVDFRDGSMNRVLFTGIADTYEMLGLPLVLVVSAIAVDEFRGHLLCNDYSLAGVNTTSTPTINNLFGGMAVGGWYGGGGVLPSRLATMIAYKLAVESGAPGVAMLEKTAFHFADKYGRSNFYVEGV